MWLRWKYQWDLIHNPEIILFDAFDESEGAKNLVKIDALFSWLKSNYGNKSVDYNYHKLNEQYIWDFAETYNKFSYNNKEHSTIVWLTKDKANVNIEKPLVNVNLTGDFHVEFTLIFNFTDSSEEAVKFTTYTYQDFSAILGRIGIKLTDDYKITLTDKYNTLFANKELTQDCDKIDVLFEGIPDFVLDKISGTERVKYIKTLLSCVVNEGGWIAGKRFDTNEELALLNLFKNFPQKEKPDDFLKALGNQKMGKDPLIKILVSSVDNKYLFIGDDSRKYLMTELLSLFSKTQEYQNFSKELNIKLNESTIDPVYAAKLSERTVAFDYKSIYARTWMDLKLGIVDVDPYLKIDADVNDQGKVTLNSYMCYGFITSEASNIKNPRDFDPFEPVIFDQKSTLGALEGFDKVFIAPAIFAYYADKEAGIQTATDVTQAGIDVATLLIPGGQLTKLGRLFFYADKISSVTSLAAGFSEENQQVRSVLTSVSIITGIVSAGETFVKPKQLENLAIKTENFSKSKSALQKEYNVLIDKINGLSTNELKQIESSKEKLAAFIETYRKELGLPENASADAIKRLNGADNVGRNINLTNFNINLSDQNILRKVDGYLDEFEAVVADDILDIIVHSDGSSFIINGKIINNKEFLEVIPEGTKTVRLLSCNNPSAATNLARELNLDVIANDGITRVHSNGVITAIPHKGKANVKWQVYQPNGTNKQYTINYRNDVKASDSYVELGTSPRVVGDIVSGVVSESLRNKIVSKLDNKADEFIKAIEGDAELAKLLSTNVDEVLEASSTLLAQGRSSLFKQPDALSAFVTIKKHSSKSLDQLGLTDEALAKIQGHSKASFANVLEDLNTFIMKLDNAPNTKVEEFTSNILNKLQLKGNNSNKVQGAHGVVKALSDEFDLLKNKTVKFEIAVDNMRGTKSFDDMTVEITTFNGNQVAKKIEVKNCENCVTAKTIKEQFIQRDLFSATSLNQLRWRIYGQNFTKEDFAKMLKENKEIIMKLPANKLMNFFRIDISKGEKITDSIIQRFVNDNYNKIFN